MPRAVFLDTSILCEVLRVPGKSQQPEEVADELRTRIRAGDLLVLPTAALIETGNHIAQVPGQVRHRLAESLAALVQATASGQAPWTLHGASWDSAFLTMICEGPGTCLQLAAMAAQGIGLGDVSIVAEASTYQQSVAGVTVEIWTLDDSLSAYAP